MNGFFKRHKEKTAQNICTVRKMEKIVSRISYFTLSTGFFAAFLTLFIGELICGRSYPDAEINYTVMTVIFFVFSVIMFLRIRRSSRSPIPATPQAAAYFTASSVRRRACLVFAIIFLLVSVILLCIYVSFIGFLFMSAGVFLLVLWLLKPIAAKRFTIDTLQVETDPYNRKSELTKSIIRWSLYWTIIIAVYIATIIFFGDWVFYLPVLFIALINFILRIAVNNPFKPFSSVRRFRITMLISRILIMTFLALFIVLMLTTGFNYNLHYINKGFDYSIFSSDCSISLDRESGVYTIRAKQDELRILQLTDIHLCSSITTVGTDKKSLDACYEIIKAADPDLIIVTGDIVYPVPVQTFSWNNMLPFMHFYQFMENIGIPWTFVYGNHDTESYAAYEIKTIESLLLNFADKVGSSLLYSANKPEIYGRYNQYLRIENSDGSLNRLAFLIDSNDYINGSSKLNEYDYVHEDQIDWYEDVIRTSSDAAGRTVPSFVFMHIPFKAFADAEAALAQGSSDAVYIAGKNSEPVSYPNYDSGFFDRMLALGSTQAVFVGHDHLNNLAVKYKGIDLVYSRSIDYIAYLNIANQTGHRGGTLIVLDKDGSYRIEPVIYEK